jgi:arylformamidase
MRCLTSQTANRANLYQVMRHAPSALGLTGFLLVAAQTFAAAPTVHRDLPYAGTRDPKQSLDVYIPADAKSGKRPIVFWIHGGGWTGGDKREMAAKPTAFVEHRFVFVSINYRLFPGASIGAIARDVAKAVRWMHDHAREFGGDGDKIFVMGHSAGAQLAALVCTDERLLAAEGLPLSILRGCVPVDGDTYDVPVQIQMESATNSKLHQSKFGDSASQKDLSPVTHVAGGKGVPAFLLIFVAKHPETSAQAQRLAKALRAAGISVQTFAAENTDHKKLNNDLGTAGDKPTASIFGFLEARSKR